MKTRGRLLTETFKRMDSLGITEAEDIIYQLAKEMDELSQAEPALNEEPMMESREPFELPKELLDRVIMIEYGPDKTTVYFDIYLKYDNAEVSPHPEAEK